MGDDRAMLLVGYLSILWNRRRRVYIGGEVKRRELRETRAGRAVAVVVVSGQEACEMGSTAFLFNGMAHHK